jgi:WD40 repeat protein
VSVEVAVFTPRPPVNLFESATLQVGTDFQNLIQPTLYAQVDGRGQVQDLRNTTAIITRAQLSNTSGTERLVTFRVRSSRRITYNTTVTAAAGQNSLRIDRFTRSRGVGAYGYDWTDTPPTRLTAEPVGTGSNARALSWTPNSQYLAMAFDNASFRVYDATSAFSTVYTSPATPSPIRPSQVAWSPTGRYLAVTYLNAEGLDQPFLRVFDFDTIGAPVEVPISDNLIRVTRTPNDIVWGGPSGRYLFIGNAGPTRVAVYDWNTGSPVFASALSTTLSTGVVGNVIGIAPNANGSRIAVSCSGGPRLLVFTFPSAITASRIVNDIFADNSQVLPGARGVAWSANSRYLVHLSSPSATIPFTVYDFDSGVALLPFPAALPPLPRLAAVSWSPDGRYICFGHAEAVRYTYYPLALPYVLLYDLNSGTPVRVTSSPALQGFGSVLGTGWSPDGDTLMIAGWAYDRFYPATGVDNVRLLDPEGNNVVVNGSFEDTTGMTRTSFGFTAVGEIVGWFSDGDPAAELFFPALRFVDAFATDGSVYLDPVANNSFLLAPNSAQLRQNFNALTAGATYRLSLDVTSSLNSDIGVRVRWNGTPVDIGGETVLPIVEDFALVSAAVPANSTVDAPLTKHMLAYGDTLQVRASGGGVDAVVSYVLNTQEAVVTITAPPDPSPDEEPGP